MLVAIHQPNFFPWLGYFDKLAKADIFVILDNVALQHTGGNYTNRVQVLLQGRPAWITMPVMRGTEARSRIDQARIAENGTWRRKLVSTIKLNYSKASHFDEIMPVLERLFSASTNSLRDFNLNGIREIANLIGLDNRKLRLASELEVSGQSTDLLISIVRAVGGAVYLVGGGAGGYQENEKFASAGIAIHQQNFRCKEYAQLHAKPFVAGLSVIDALMNCGPTVISGLLSELVTQSDSRRQA